MAFKSPPTSVTVSPTGEFLATTHSNQLGIALWADRSFYQTVYLTGTPKKPTMMDDPAPAAEVEGRGAMAETLELSKAEEARVRGEKERREGMEEGERGDGEDGPVFPKAQGLVTTSGLPAGHWKNLFHLDLVKARNKPKEAPKKPESAPFFLQKWGGLGGGVLDKVDEKQVAKEVKKKAEKKIQEEVVEKELEGWDAAWSDDEEGGGDDWGGEGDGGNEGFGGSGDGSKLIKSFKDGGGLGGKKIVEEARNKLAALLVECDKVGHFGAVQSYLASLTPSAIDVAMMTLCSGSHDEEGIDLHVLFCKYLDEACKTGCNFEAVGAYMSRFFAVHGEVIRGGDVEGKEGEVGEKRREQLRVMREVVGELVEGLKGMGGRLAGKFKGSLNTLRIVGGWV